MFDKERPVELLPFHLCRTSPIAQGSALDMTSERRRDLSLSFPLEILPWLKIPTVLLSKIQGSVSK